MRVILLACVLAAACGDNTRNVVQVDLRLGTPDLIVYRDDVGGWQSPDRIAEGSYTLSVVDDFELIAVYEIEGGGFIAQELAATYGEGSHWVFVATSDFGGIVVGKTAPASVFRDPCWLYPIDGRVAVTAEMVQAGHVAMDQSCKSSTVAPWMFSLSVRPGT